MKISVIIAAYNAEKYLVETLQSVVNQTLDDYEIITINDGSKDGTLNILKEYEKEYPNFTVISKENGGVSAARNDGLNVAQGKYVYFYDADVTKKAASLKPSARGEYEITDLNKLYLDEGTLQVELFGRGFAWLDTGNCDSLLEASNFVATIQNRQGFYVSCIEEIAWRNGWITTAQLRILGEQLGKTEYGKYLLDLAK